LGVKNIPVGLGEIEKTGMSSIVLEGIIPSAKVKPNS
jgi:hypothetical protein